MPSQRRKIRLLEAFAAGDEAEFDETAVGKCFKSAEADVLRGAVLKTGKRIDGRDTKRSAPLCQKFPFCPAPTALPCSRVGNAGAGHLYARHRPG